MPAVVDGFLREQLHDRRQLLKQAAVAQTDDSARLHALLTEVDAALGRLDNGSYGLCETCHEAIESDRLICDPLVRFCLDHLSKHERNALERDLELAARVQRGLLPNQSFENPDWHIRYRYEPAGLVSGDYCDVIDAGDAGLYFMVGDVSGKGVAASMLMAHLHAMFRTLISFGLSLQCMLGHASRVFSESTLPNQYATLVCGRALPNGRIEISNAGHPAPLIVKRGSVDTLEISNLPLGLFCEEHFTVGEIQLSPGEGIVIYSDGVSEAADMSGAIYGDERIRSLVGPAAGVNPSALVSACIDDLTMFRSHAPKTDDVTFFVLGRKH
jgi:sigma-B regulation protein RsbU (phosphoserine phosphatase)